MVYVIGWRPIAVGDTGAVCRLLPCGQYAGSGGAIGIANTRHWRGYVLGPLALARIRHAQARHGAGRSSCRAHERFDIGFGRRDGGNFELFDEEIEDIGRNERWKRRPDADVFDAEVEQCEQDADGFLFVPREHERER